MGDLNIPRDTTKPPLAPWKTLTALNTDRAELTKRKTEYSQEQLLQLTNKKIEEIQCDIRIYTDGSTHQNQENGGAGVYIEDESGEVLHEACFPDGKYCSSYSAECVAMLKALEWIQLNPLPALICTDSMSLQQALQNNN